MHVYSICTVHTRVYLDLWTQNSKKLIQYTVHLNTAYHYVPKIISIHKSYVQYVIQLICFLAQSLGLSEDNQKNG